MHKSCIQAYDKQVLSFGRHEALTLHTLCIFFLWSWVKEQFNKSKPKTLSELELEIQQVFEHIPLHLFMWKAEEDVQKRLPKCFANIGSYMEIAILYIIVFQ